MVEWVLGPLRTYLLLACCNYFILSFIVFKFIGLVFLLSKEDYKGCQSKVQSVLWNGKDENAAKAKLAWNAICYPKKEDGLGLKDLETLNISSMLRHVWCLFARSSSIWVAWIQAYLLKGKS